MIKWEYRIVGLHRNKNLANQLGSEGWELVTVSDGTAYFTRPLEEDSTQKMIGLDMGERVTEHTPPDTSIQLIT